MNDTVLDVYNVSKAFALGRMKIDAVRNVSCHVEPGEVVGIVGESGCGKSTLARLITRLIKPDGGKIVLCGEEITHIPDLALKKTYSHIKMIFQEPRSSFDPRLTLGASIRETLAVTGRFARHERKLEAERLLCEVGLDESYARLFPREVSGGECQRAAIARAIAGRPKLLVCDEATSALDVSVQAQILELLKDIKDKHAMSILFISHDLALVSSFCDRTYVMSEGEIIESGKTSQIIHNPQHEYTKKLIASVL